MLSFKDFITEETDTTEWMTGHELASHISKPALRQISKSKEHIILTNHDLAHGGTGQLSYRIHTKTYGSSKVRTVQAASPNPDKDGFTHHVTYDLVRNSAHVSPGSHLKTNNRLKIVLPFHQKV